MNNLSGFVVACCLTVLPLVTTGGAALADSWVKLATGDFDVLMPFPAQSLTNGITGTRIYRCSNKSNNFIVSVSNPGVQKDSYKRFLQGIEQGLKTRGGKIIASTPARGKGWTGTLLQAEFNDNAKNTTLVAMADGVPVIYTLGVNLPVMDTDSQKFMHSLVIYPAQAALLPIKRPDSREGEDAARETLTDAQRLEELGAPPDGDGSAETGSHRRKGKGFIDATSISILMPTIVLILLLIRFVATLLKRKKS